MTRPTYTNAEIAEQKAAMLADIEARFSPASPQYQAGHAYADYIEALKKQLLACESSYISAFWCWGERDAFQTLKILALQAQIKAAEAIDVSRCWTRFD